MKDLLQMLKALSDLTRLRILKIIAIKPLCVCEIMAVLKMAQSTTSQHLTILANAGLIEAEPGGVWTVYRLAKLKSGSAAERLIDFIKKAKATEQSRQDEMLARKADRERICRLSPEKTFKQRKG